MIYFKSAHINLKLYQCDIIIFKSGETEKLTAEILVLYQLTMEGVSGLLFITSLGAALCLQCLCLQCFDTVGWAAGRASGL